MGKGENQEYHMLWLFSAMMLLMGLIPFLLVEKRSFENIHWLDVIYISFLLMFLILHVWIDMKGRSIGHNEVLLYIFSTGSLIGMVMVVILQDLDEMSLRYDGNHIFSTLQWFGLILFSFLPPLFFTVLFFVFSPRDLKFEMRRVRLPISRYMEWRCPVIAWVRPEDIVEVYPRWTLTITGNEGRFIKRPVYGAVEKGGYGIRLKDGRRFGYEPTSRIILEKDLRSILGNLKFDDLKTPHSRMTEKEWDVLKEKVSHWYSSQDGTLVILVLAGLLLMFVQGALLTLLRSMLDIWVPLFLISSLVYFGPMFLIFLNDTSRWFFIKGTVFRMKEKGEKLPDWLEIKEDRILLKRQ